MTDPVQATQTEPPTVESPVVLDVEEPRPLDLALRLLSTLSDEDLAALLEAVGAERRRRQGD